MIYTRKRMKIIGQNLTPETFSSLFVLNTMRGAKNSLIVEQITPAELSTEQSNVDVFIKHKHELAGLGPNVNPFTCRDISCSNRFFHLQRPKQALHLNQQWSV